MGGGCTASHLLSWTAAATPFLIELLLQQGCCCCIIIMSCSLVIGECLAPGCSGRLQRVCALPHKLHCQCENSLNGPEQALLHAEESLSTWPSSVYA